MEARAQIKYARISPRKVQIVLDLIRNKPVDVALAIVRNTPKAASEYLEKLLQSAAANAETNHNLDRNNLYVAECFACPAYSQAYPSECQVVRSALQEDFTHHPCAQGKGIRGGILWDRKSIPTVLESVLSRIGIHAGSSRRASLPIP